MRLDYDERRAHERREGGGGVLQAVGMREIQRIFEVTDALGIHREKVVIPLRPRSPGQVRRLPDGRLEIVVAADEPFDGWLLGLEARLRALG
jgi:hypothetical protein